MELYENKEEIEFAFLVGVHRGAINELEDTTDETIAELARLAETAGAVVVGSLIQNKEKIDSANFIGSGKLEELKIICDNNGVNLLIFDDELTGSQIRNIENYTGITTIDRSRLILDIFARHATTKEGKCQVELAQLNYLKPRLTGRGNVLSRQGGGIGTRGPGETKLETDRRHINERIVALKKELEQIKEHRANARKKRKKDGIPVVALVGYTNAGKTTLLNLLTNAGALAEDKLFATLDPLVRRLRLSDINEVLLVDTVGFIRKLPHHLIQAFHSTLEEAVYADVLLHLVDSSSPECEKHIKVVENILEKIGAGGKPVITIYNKCDLTNTQYSGNKNSVSLSCKTGRGIDELLGVIEKTIPQTKKQVTLLIPYTNGSVLSALHSNSVVISEEYAENGVLITAVVDAPAFGKVKDYLYEL